MMRTDRLISHTPRTNQSTTPQLVRIRDENGMTVRTSDSTRGGSVFVDKDIR